MVGDRPLQDEDDPRATGVVVPGFTTNPTLMRKAYDLAFQDKTPR